MFVACHKSSSYLGPHHRTMFTKRHETLRNHRALWTWNKGEINCASVWFLGSWQFDKDWKVGCWERAATLKVLFVCPCVCLCGCVHAPMHPTKVLFSLHRLRNPLCKVNLSRFPGWWLQKSLVTLRIYHEQLTIIKFIPESVLKVPTIFVAAKGEANAVGLLSQLC